MTLVAITYKLYSVKRTTQRKGENKMKLFNECLEDAKGLVKTKARNEFIPALDDLANDDIESVIAKVQIELDLANEGEIVTHYQTKRKAEAFIEKWETILEEEKEEEDKEITEEVKEMLLAQGTKVAKKAHDALIEIEGQVFDMGNGKMYIEKTYRIHEYVIKPIEKVTGLNRDTWDARKDEK